MRHSIRWRFTLSISLVLLVAVGVAFAIIYQQATDSVSGEINQDLVGDTTQLQQSLRLVDREPGAGSVSSIKRYVSSQSFRSISTLLVVFVPGHSPISNYGEVFEPSAPDDGESVQEQDAENRLADAISHPILGTSTHVVADVGRVRLLERPVAIGDARVVVGAGEPLTTLIRAQHGVVHSFALAGAFIALAVLLGSYLVGTRLTAPLRRMAQVAAQVDAGDLDPRMEAAAVRRDEIGVLAAAFDHMLARLDSAFRGQREFIADASHELRTPLTIIQGQLEVLANRRSIDRADVRRVERLVGGEIARMRRLIDDLLLLAQTERPDFLKCDQIELEPFINEIWDGASLIADRNFELGPVPAGRLLADPDRLAQAIRNLINNAIDHTTAHLGLIRLETTAVSPDGIVITVLDDGPGIPPDELERIFQRFHRSGADRAGRTGGLGNAGLGLAIVRAIAEAHGGAATAGNRQGFSGAIFELSIPGFSGGSSMR
jgi:two-component system OmpR family sensor kinase